MRKKASVWFVAEPEPNRARGISRPTRPGASSPSGGIAVASKPALGHGLLVIMELGGEWPSSLLSSAAASRRVLTQADGEPPSVFAERVASSLDGLFDRKIPLQTVVIACNERLDEAAESARRRTLSLTLGRMAMAKHPSGHVYLAASARSSGRLRHALSSVAQGLFDEWRTAGLEVSVDFGETAGEHADTKPLALTAHVA